MTKLTAVATMMSLPVVAITACSSPQHASTQPGTTPPVQSGSPAATTSAPSVSSAPGAGSLAAELKTPDGKSAATATFDFTGGYVTITVKTVAPGILAPGFHGMHIHEIGKCEPNSVAPAGGPPGPSATRQRHADHGPGLSPRAPAASTFGPRAAACVPPSHLLRRPVALRRRSASGVHARAVLRDAVPVLRERGTLGVGPGAGARAVHRDAAVLRDGNTADGARVGTGALDGHLVQQALVRRAERPRARVRAGALLRHRAGPVLILLGDGATP